MNGFYAELHRHTPEQLLALTGMRVPDSWKHQEIATVGKKQKIVSSNNTWADNFLSTHFEDSASLSSIIPETVSTCPISVTINGKSLDVPTKKGIVGDISGRLYAIHSNQYRPIQHSTTVKGLKYALADTNLSAFGHCEQTNGRFTMFAGIANPDFVVDVSDNPRMPDYYMMGISAYNSHDGDGKYGGRIFGLRSLCTNGCTFEEEFGSFSAVHKGKSSEDVSEDIAKSLSKIICNVIDKFPMFQNRVHIARDIPLTQSEAENVLWALRYEPYQIDSIIAHKSLLNPEITGYTLSAYDLYNATTAYVSHRVGGSHMTKGNMSLSSIANTILTDDVSRLIDEGDKARTTYYEELQAKEQRKAGALTLSIVKGKEGRF